MKTFDELAVHHSDGLAFLLGLGKSLDDLARLRDLGLVRREDAVGGLDLLGVDQRLAVEAKLKPLAAGGLIALGIFEIEVDAVL